jgi:DNA-binding MarR family transcriptional regulator
MVKRDELGETAETLHSVAVRIIRRARVADRESGLGPAQLSALSVLYFSGRVPVTALAEAEQVAQPTMTRIVASLVAQKAVTRAASPDDRRVQLVEINAKGRRIFEAAREKRLAIIRKVLDHLPPTTVTALRPLLDELAEAVNAPD